MALGLEQVSLREAVYAARFGNPEADTIILPVGNTYELTLPYGADNPTSDQRLFGDLDVTGDITIRGQDPTQKAVIEQTQPGFRVIDHHSGTLHLEHLTLRGGGTDNSGQKSGGGVLSRSGDITIRDSIVSGNTSEEAGGGVYSAGSTTIERSTIIGNTALLTGGGIHSAGPLTLVDSYIDGNKSSTDGGGLYTELAGGEIDNTRFLSNEATLDGGALFSTGSIDVVSSLFEDNTAGRDGGAVHTEKDLFISDSGFNRNTATDRGGALKVEGDAFVERSSFVSNKALLSVGGAIYKNFDGVVDVENTTFSENSAEQGGAIYTTREAIIHSSTFWGNTANSAAAAVFARDSLSVSSTIELNNLLAGASGSVWHSDSKGSLGHNVLDSTELFTRTTDLEGVNAQLGPITNWPDDHNGFVRVHPLLADSPAINAGKWESPGATDSQGLFRDEIPDAGASEYDSDTSAIFWSDSDGDIYRSDPRFLNVQKLQNNRANPNSFSADTEQSRLYWLESNNSNVNWMRLDGDGSVASFFSGLSDATALMVDSVASQLYIGFAGATPRIDRYDLNDGTLLSSWVSPNISHPEDMTINHQNQRIFWAEQGADGFTESIRSLDLDGNNYSLDASDAFALTPGTGAQATSNNSTLAAALDVLGNLNLGTGTMTVSVSLGIGQGTALSYEDSNEGAILFIQGSDDILAIHPDTGVPFSQYSHNFDIVSLEMMPTSTITAKPTLVRNNALVVDEGGIGVIDDLVLFSNDADTSADNILYISTSLPLNGELSVDGVRNAITFTQAQVTAGLVRYIHSGTETTVDQLEFRLADDNHSTNRFMLDININPINDAPQFTSSPIKTTLLEGGAYPFSSANIIVQDTDNERSDFRYHHSNNLASGYIEVNGIKLGPGNTFTQAQLDSGSVAYQHDGSEQSPADIQLIVSDGESESETAAVISFDFRKVNDAPELSIAASPVGASEGQRIVLNSAYFYVVDPDDEINNLLYRYTSELQAGTLLLNDIPLAPGSTFTHQQLLAGALDYQHDGSELHDETIAFEVTDGKDRSETRFLDFQIEPVNDVPQLSITGSPIETVEGQDVAINADVFTVTDPDSDIASFVYRMTSELQAGSLLLSGEPLVQGSPFTQEQLAAGTLSYRHDGSEQHSDSIAFDVTDGENLSQVQILDVNIQPINDQPILQISDTEPELLEGGSLSFTADDLLMVDADNPESDARFRYVSVLQNGKLEINNQLLPLNEWFTHEDLSNGNLVYHHDGSESRTEMIDWIVSDGQMESTAVTMMLDVLAVNDPPIWQYSLGAAKGDNYRLPADVVFDADNATLVFSASLENDQPLPDWLAFDVDSLRFSVVDPSSTTPELRVLIKADDGQGGIVTAPLNLQFDPVLAAATPVNNNEPNTPVKEPVQAQSSSIIKNLLNKDVGTNNEVTEVAKSESVSSAPVVKNTTKEQEVESEQAIEDSMTLKSNHKSLFNDIDIVSAQNADDIHDLISPLENFGSLELINVDNSIENLTENNDSMPSILDFNIVDLNSLINFQGYEQSNRLDSYLRAAEDQEYTLVKDADAAQYVIGTTAGLSTSLSLGYFLWLLRGGTLMGSVLTALPAWHLVDPLPILESMGKDSEDDDDESLESLVESR